MLVCVGCMFWVSVLVVRVGCVSSFDVLFFMCWCHARVMRVGVYVLASCFGCVWVGVL